MNIFKSKQIGIFLVLIGIVFSFTQCRSTTKGVKEDTKRIETATKNEASKIKNETKESLENDKMYFDYKMEHAKVLLQLEKAKAHFIIENDKFKADADLSKAQKHLTNLEKNTDKGYHSFINKMKADIASAKQSIKNGDKTAKTKLENISKSFTSEIKTLEHKISSEKKAISNDDKRHFAELRAKEYLFKAKFASRKETGYPKAEEYLDKADKEYLIAKQYGNEKYDTTIEKLRENINSAKKSLQAKEINSFKDIENIIIELDGYSEPMNGDSYIIILQ